MAGGNIHCGSYESGDKSGSAFEGVLKDIRAHVQEIAEDIERQLEEGEYVLIEVAEVKKLIEPLTNYRDNLIEEIGHDNFDKEIAREEEAGMDPVDGKWGESRGWRLYCVNDLLGACQTSLKENEPVCIAFS